MLSTDLQEDEILKIAKKIRKNRQLDKLSNLEKRKAEILTKTAASIADNEPLAYHKDAVKFLQEFEDNSIDLVITDPPYMTDVQDIVTFVQSWVPLAISKVKENGRLFICTGAYPGEIATYLNSFAQQNKFIVDNPLIWTYKNTLGRTPLQKYNLNYQVIWHLYSKSSPFLDQSITSELFSVQEINAPDGRLGDRYHMWQKPLVLGQRLIRQALPAPALVVDCFAGTGTFLIAAAQLGHRAIGCDNNVNNLAIAQQRGVEIK